MNPSGSMLAAAGSRRRAVISLTPLIDVVFILLLFFMLTSTFSRYFAQELSAAVAAESSSVAQDVEPLVLEVLPNGILRAEGDEFPRDSLRFSEMLQIWLKDQRSLLVRPEATVSVQDVITVMDELASRGVASVNLLESFGGEPAS